MKEIFSVFTLQFIMRRLHKDGSIP